MYDEIYTELKEFIFTQNSALEKAEASKTKEPKKDMVTATRISDEITIGDSDVVSKYITIQK